MMVANLPISIRKKQPYEKSVATIQNTDRTPHAYADTHIIGTLTGWKRMRRLGANTATVTPFALTTKL
jgi:hypothetical protein